MPTIPANDVTLSYEDTGGIGRPVVLVHGWPLSGASWSAQVPALLDAGYRVVTYDRRGFGGSDKPETGYDYDTFAADLASVIDGLDLQDVTIVGFSMGGGEVARYLATYGGAKVRSAVLAAAVPPYLLKTDDNPDGGLADADVVGMVEGASSDRVGFLDGFTTSFFSSGGVLKVTEEQRQDALSQAARAGDAALTGCIEAFARTDFRADLAAISVPTLVIHGDGDATVPFEVSGKRSVEAISGAELVLLKDAPHGLNVSHSGEFNAALVEFLGR